MNSDRAMFTQAGDVPGDNASTQAIRDASTAMTLDLVAKLKRAAHYGWVAVSDPHIAFDPTVPTDSETYPVTLSVDAIAVADCPECVQGKHLNCDATTWSERLDRAVPCPCHIRDHHDRGTPPGPHQHMPEEEIKRAP